MRRSITGQANRLPHLAASVADLSTGPECRWGRRFACPVILTLALSATMLFAQRTTMFPPVRGTHEMVGAANNFEVEAGFRILTQGGNAVDAGVATILAASVTEQARFGIG